MGLIFVYYPLKGTGSGFPPASHVRLEKSAIWYIPNGNWAFNPSTSSILELVQKEGRRVVKRPVTLYNLDMIISVGFRVNTQRGIKFRRWANQVLKEYMLKGYAINQRKISTDLQIVDRLHEQRQLIEGQGAEIAELRNTTEKRLGEQDSRLSAVEQRIDFFVKSPWYLLIHMPPSRC